MSGNIILSLDILKTGKRIKDTNWIICCRSLMAIMFPFARRMGGPTIVGALPVQNGWFTFNSSMIQKSKRKPPASNNYIIVSIHNRQQILTTNVPETKKSNTRHATLHQGASHSMSVGFQDVVHEHFTTLLWTKNISISWWNMILS